VRDFPSSLNALRHKHDVVQTFNRPTDVASGVPETLFADGYGNRGGAFLGTVSDNATAQIFLRRVGVN
jgi:hypothetical protein